MAHNGAVALGAPEIAGALVNPTGYMKKTVAGAAGREVARLVGSAAAALGTRDGNKGVSSLPDFGRVGYVGVSATEVALAKTKYGWKMKPSDEALARAPRSELASAELEQGMVSHLSLRFANGQLGSSISRDRTRKRRGRSSRSSRARAGRTPSDSMCCRCGAPERSVGPSRNISLLRSGT